MNALQEAKDITCEYTKTPPKMGDIKKRAKAIKRNHDLAWALWETGAHYSRMLAALIFDTKQLTPQNIETLAADLAASDDEQRNYISEWLLANQLTKNKTLSAFLTECEQHQNPVLRRLFWYHQARLRWTGNSKETNSEQLMASLESRLASEDPMVQWAMNFCAGQIGTYEPEYRDRCIQLGESTGLYRDEKVPKNCTPNYLPEFIRIQVSKI